MERSSVRREVDPLYLVAGLRLLRRMDSNFFSERTRPSDAIAHLLVGLLPVITLAGILGSLCGVPHTSILLYWPVALVVIATACSFRPARTQTSGAPTAAGLGAVGAEG